MTQEVYRPPAQSHEPNLDWTVVFWRAVAANSVTRTVTFTLLNRDDTARILGADDAALVVEGEILLAFDATSDDLGRAVRAADFSSWRVALRPAPEIRVYRSKQAIQDRHGWCAVLWSAIAMNNGKLRIQLVREADTDAIFGDTSIARVSPGEILLSHDTECPDIGRALKCFDIRPDMTILATEPPVFLTGTRRFRRPFSRSAHRAWLAEKETA